MVKCREVLQCSDGLSNKVTKIIRRQRQHDICCLYVFYYYHILSYSIGSIFYQYIYIYIFVFLFNTVIYVFFLFLCLCILILCLCIFNFLATLTEVFPCFFFSCKANARVKSAKTGHGPHSSKKFCVVLCIVCV